MPRLLDQTRSPGSNLPAASPSTTVPTRSLPTAKGNGSNVGQRPERTYVSTWLTATVSTATRASVGPNAGMGSSPAMTDSAGPVASMYAARMTAGIPGPLPGYAALGAVIAQPTAARGGTAVAGCNRVPRARWGPPSPQSGR